MTYWVTLVTGSKPSRTESDWVTLGHVHAGFDTRLRSVELLSPGPTGWPGQVDPSLITMVATYCGPWLLQVFFRRVFLACIWNCGQNHRFSHATAVQRQWVVKLKLKSLLLVLFQCHFRGKNGIPPSFQILGGNPNFPHFPSIVVSVSHPPL